VSGNEQTGSAMSPEPTVSSGGRRESGALESEVMAAVWAAAGPVSAAQVHEAVGGDLHYKTVLTVLTRLLEKGLVTRERAGRAHLYAASRAEAELVAEQMSAALRRSGDHGAVLQRFLTTLAPADAAELRGLLATRDPDQ